MMRAFGRTIATMQIVGASSGAVLLIQGLLSRWPGFVSLLILLATLAYLVLAFLSGISL